MKFQIKDSKAKHDNFQVDFIDINCGCPIDLINDKGAGCALPTKEKKLFEGYLFCVLFILMFNFSHFWDEKCHGGYTVDRQSENWTEGSSFCIFFFFIFRKIVLNI